MTAVKILVVDDDSVIRSGLERILTAAGYQVEPFSGGRAAVERLQRENFGLVITDLKMPGMSGLEVLNSIRVLQPQIPIIVITGYATVETAVEAMKSGAVDYLAKPFSPEQLCAKITSALAGKTVMIDDLRLREELQQSRGFEGFVGTSPEMEKVYRRIMQVAPTDSTVLVSGESGTGKELVARAIHNRSPRRERPFVAVDCTALAENLLESELFGHVKGSFTGAIHTKAGLFKQADSGTLFLDEISNLSLATQAKLLRVLQERVVTPIGSTQPLPINIRLIAATNQPLRQLVANGSFREDLYFRLNIIPIELPALRERKGDLRLLIAHFLEDFAAEFAKEVRGIVPEALAMLESYPFPGNVRELENHIERAVVLAQGELVTCADLELNTEAPTVVPAGIPIPQNLEELKEQKRLLREQAVEPLEKAFLLEALRRNDGNVSRAAEEVGMLRPNFHALLKKLGVNSRQYQSE